MSGPEIEPISLDEARRQLKLDPDLTDENDLITDYIGGAREQVEQYTKRTFCESTWLLTLYDFPRHSAWGDSRIELPQGPVIAVLGISYLANDGTRTHLGAEGWLDGLSDEPAWVAPPYGELWPSGRVVGNSVEIEYRAGYPGAGSPPDASGVPKSVKQCMKAIVTRWFEKREQTDVSDLLGSIHHLRVYP